MNLNGKMLQINKRPAKKNGGEDLQSQHIPEKYRDSYVTHKGPNMNNYTN